LERLRGTNVGFADAFLAAGGAEENVAVASFDRDLDKFRTSTFRASRVSRSDSMSEMAAKERNAASRTWRN